MMKKIALGGLDIQVSRVGLGTVKFGRNQGVKYPAQFMLPSDDEIEKLLFCAQNLGINFLDTAPAYGASEERLGKLLGARQDWVICSKVGEEFIDGQSHFDFTPPGIRRSVERSLKRLNTDYLDVLLVHSNGEDVKIINELAVFSVLQKLKEDGLIRAYGMSTKTIEGGLLAVDHSDVVMVTYNPLQTGERPVISYAHEKNKGVLVKKALASGYIEKISADDPIQAAMKFIFAERGVGSVIIGTLNPKHLEHNVSAACQAVLDGAQ